MKKKGLIVSIIAVLIVIIISVIFYRNFSKNYSISIKSPNDVVKEIKSKFSSGDTKGKNSPNSSSGNSGTNTNDNTNSTGNNNENNSNTTGNKNTSNKEGEQVTKNVSITLKMSEAVIGTKVNIVIGDDVKAKYSDIAFYVVFDGDNQISPQAKVDDPTLVMANKKENDIVKVKLLDSNAKVLAKLNAKLVK